MKAQRRHELKANSLIWHLQGLPEKIKEYQSQIALGLVVIALAVLMVRYRINAAQQRLAEAYQGLNIASDDLQRLKQFYPSANSAELMAHRAGYYAEGLQEADQAFQKAPDNLPMLKAEALLDKGDINFEMANSPELPGAASQPALRPAESDDSLLASAHDAYAQVLHDFADQKFAVTAAHFGLAAVAEDRAASDASQWDAAKAEYQAIVDSDAEPAFKAAASQRLQILPQLQRPAAVGLSVLTGIGPAAPATRK